MQARYLFHVQSGRIRTTSSLAHRVADEGSVAGKEPGPGLNGGTSKGAAAFMNNAG